MCKITSDFVIVCSVMYIVTLSMINFDIHDFYAITLALIATSILLFYIIIEVVIDLINLCNED